MIEVLQAAELPDDEFEAVIVRTCFIGDPRRDRVMWKFLEVVSMIRQIPE